MTSPSSLDLDALEALWRDQRYSQTHKLLDAMPELIRLARIGQRVERDAKRPDPMSQALNEGDGVYRP